MHVAEKNKEQDPVISSCFLFSGEGYIDILSRKILQKNFAQRIDFDENFLVEVVHENEI